MALNKRYCEQLQLPTDPLRHRLNPDAKGRKTMCDQTIPDDAELNPPRATPVCDSCRRRAEAASKKWELNHPQRRKKYAVEPANGPKQGVHVVSGGLPSLGKKR